MAISDNNRDQLCVRTDCYLAPHAIDPTPVHYAYMKKETYHEQLKFVIVAGMKIKQDDQKYPLGRDARTPARMDFVIEKTVTDDTTRTVYFQLAPDPRRYIEIEIEGKYHYLDKFLHYAFPKDELLKAGTEQMVGLPMFYNPPTVKSAVDYADARKVALNEELSGKDYTAPKELSDSHKNIGEVVAPRSMSFLSVDICSSSALRRSNPTGFDKAYNLLLRELATSVGQFHGSILKTTGDGFIAYLDYPGFTTLCDNTIDLGLTLIMVLRDSINPALGQAGLPELSIRVGADYGETIMRDIRVPTTGYETKEVASDALNRAVKIEETAAPNEFRIGRILYELVHVQWLERCEEVSFESEQVGIPGYKVYRVR